RQIFEPLAQQRGIALDMAAPGAAAEAGQAPLQLTGNRKAIAGALTNLLENAFDAAAGRVALEVRVDGSCIEFVVEDNGRGIPQETLDRVFEPFFTTRVEGSGLGLAIARGVARAHGGGIEVSSRLGEGTRFAMRLQRAAATTEQDTEQDTEQ